MATKVLDWLSLESTVYNALWPPIQPKCDPFTENDLLAVDKFVSVNSGITACYFW